MKKIDLQMHTTFSDGKFSPQEVIDFALAKGMEAIAITDHDSVKGIVPALAYCKNKPIIFVPGIELSCRENFYEGTIDVLGLFIDHTNTALEKFIARDKERRIIEKKEIVTKLQKLGYQITFDELTKESGESLGRPIIARMLVKKYPDTFKTVNEVFANLIGEGKPAYVYREKASIKGAIAVIHEAGGISVLAHPGRYGESTDKIIRKFIDDGGKGIEVYYPYKKIFKISIEQEEALIKKFSGIAKKENLLVSGGSDFHDFERGTEIGDGGISREEFKKFSHYQKSRDD